MWFFGERRTVTTISQQTRADTIRDQAINVRASRWQRDLIDRAAHVSGKSRSEFMLETTCREAEDGLLNQAFFRLDGEAFAEFAAMLDEPAKPTAELRELLHTPAQWE